MSVINSVFLVNKWSAATRVKRHKIFLKSERNKDACKNLLLLYNNSLLRALDMLNRN